MAKKAPGNPVLRTKHSVVDPDHDRTHGDQIRVDGTPGIPIDDPQHIWYNAYENYSTIEPTFADCRKAVVDAGTRRPIKNAKVNSFYVHDLDRQEQWKHTSFWLGCTGKSLFRFIQSSC